MNHNFARRGGFIGVAPVDSIGPRAAKRIPCARLVRVELHGEILTHGFGNGVTTFTRFDTFLGEHFYFGASVLEPNLHGTLSHVDFLGNSLPCGSSRSRVLVEFHLESRQLILGSPLALVVLLLLGQGAFAMRTARG